MPSKPQTQNVQPHNFVAAPAVAANDSDALTVLSDALNALVIGESQELHLEQETGLCRVRSRVSGLLTEFKYPSNTLVNDLLNELNVEFRESFSKHKIRLPLMQDVHTLELSHFRTSFGQSLTVVVCFAHIPSSLDQTRLNDQSVNKLRNLITDAPNGLTLITCNEVKTLRDTYYALLNEANDMEHKVVSLETKPDAVVPRINQVNLSSNTNTEELIELCTEYADRVFINAGNIANIDERIIRTLQAAPYSANIFVSGISTAHVLQQLARMDLLTDNANSFLTKIVELRSTRLICPHCADFHNVSDRDQQWLKSSTVIKGEALPQAFNQACGCERCKDTGCDGSITLMSACDVDEALIESTSISYKAISNALQTKMDQNSVQCQHETLARQGKVRFEDFRRS